MPTSIANIIGDINSLGVMLLLSAIISKIFLKNKVLLFLLLVILSIILLRLPVYYGTTFIMFIRGILGDLSICGLIILFLLAILYFTNLNIDILLPKSICAIFTGIGFILYLSTLGYIKTDIYAFGYEPNIYILIMLFCLMLIIWHFSWLFAISFLIGIMSYHFKVQLSTNLWDYIFDPILWLIMICRLIVPSRAR